MIDSHCHLYEDDFCSDIDEVLSRAYSAGVSDIIVSGTSIERNNKTLEFCHRINSRNQLSLDAGFRTFPDVYATLGLSPFLAVRATESEIDETILHLISLLNENDSAVIGIGEAGLDHFYHKDEGEQLRQKIVFERVIEVAAKFDLPLVIHGRDAEDECLDMVLSGGLKKVVFHSYGGSPEVMKKILDNGYIISLSTLVCNSSRHKKLAKEVDLSRLFLETDSPYLSPRKMSGFPRNEPSFVCDSFKKVASLRNMDPDELTKQVDSNIREFYGI